jgi:uncharacterized protein
MIAIDTNLLIYAHRAALPEHRGAREAIETASRDSRGWGIALPSIAEFWGIVTHPASRGGASTPRQAEGFLRELIVGAGAKLWTPREGFWDRLVELARELRIAGPRIFDLQIALTASENGAVEIWTHDVRFVASPGLRVRNPLA